jgi:hypothetical protein
VNEHYEFLFENARWRLWSGRDDRVCLGLILIANEGVHFMLLSHFPTRKDNG